MQCRTNAAVLNEENGKEESGAVIHEEADRGEEIPAAAKTPSSSEKIDWKGAFNGLKKIFFDDKSTAWKVGIVLAFLVGIFIFVMILRLVFSNIVVLIAVAAGGYIVYHRWAAKYITEFIYDFKSKELWLPEGMTAETLLKELSGKFNYPYFNGVRYGEEGECVIEGRYSVYPVEFDGNNNASLDCDLKVDDKKMRAVMLEAMAIRDYINKFFNPLQSIDVVKSFKTLKSAERQRKMVAVVVSVATFLIILILSLEYVVPGSIQRITRPGLEVRDAYLSQYSSKVTVEEAFENFFDNPKWSTYEEAGYSYVLFTGICEFAGERADVRVRFQITGEQFRIDSVDVNGQKQSDFILLSLLSAIYEDY